MNVGTDAVTPFYYAFFALLFEKRKKLDFIYLKRLGRDRIIFAPHSCRRQHHGIVHTMPIEGQEFLAWTGMELRDIAPGDRRDHEWGEERLVTSSTQGISGRSTFIHLV